VRLQDEDVGAADGLAEAAVQLTVGERRQVGLAQLDEEMGGDLLGQRDV
jgi:hypothetical protein